MNRSPISNATSRRGLLVIALMTVVIVSLLMAAIWQRTLALTVRARQLSLNAQVDLAADAVRRAQIPVTSLSLPNNRAVAVDGDRVILTQESRLLAATRLATETPPPRDARLELNEVTP